MEIWPSSAGLVNAKYEWIDGLVGITCKLLVRATLNVLPSVREC